MGCDRRWNWSFGKIPADQFLKGVMAIQEQCCMETDGKKIGKAHPVTKKMNSWTHLPNRPELPVGSILPAQPCGAGSAVWLNG